MKSIKHTGKSKLTLDQVILALTELKHVSGRALAKKWNVSHATVNNARNGNSWASKLRLLGFPVKQRSNPVKEKTLQPIQE
jgi:biotin operon repressor